MYLKPQNHSGCQAVISDLHESVRERERKRERKQGKEGEREIAFFAIVKNIINITDVFWIMYGELDQEAQKSELYY